MEAEASEAGLFLPHYVVQVCKDADLLADCESYEIEEHLY